jgi:RNA polymerase sigma factor for flagellar operon FliA
MVRSIAWKIHRKLPSRIDLEDLIAYGQLGLAEAARDYRAELGTQFTTFAYYRVRGSILDGLSKMNWFNKADYARGRYERMADQVMDQSDSAADAQLEEDMSWFRETTRSLGIVYLFSQSQQPARPNTENAIDSSPSPMETVIQSELARRLWQQVDQLPDEERIFIRTAYVEGLSLKEAGERIGISKAWASRLHGRILQKLALAFAAD